MTTSLYVKYIRMLIRLPVLGSMSLHLCKQVSYLFGVMIPIVVVLDVVGLASKETCCFIVQTQFNIGGTAVGLTDLDVIAILSMTHGGF